MQWNGTQLMSTLDRFSPRTSWFPGTACTENSSPKCLLQSVQNLSNLISCPCTPRVPYSGSIFYPVASEHETFSTSHVLFPFLSRNNSNVPSTGKHSSSGHHGPATCGHRRTTYSWAPHPKLFDLRDVNNYALLFWDRQMHTHNFGPKFQWKISFILNF